MKHKRRDLVCLCCWDGVGGGGQYWCLMALWWVLNEADALIFPWDPAPSKALPLVIDIWAGMASLSYTQTYVCTSLFVWICTNRKHILILTIRKTPKPSLNPELDSSKVKTSQLSLHFPQLSSFSWFKNQVGHPKVTHTSFDSGKWSCSFKFFTFCLLGVLLSALLHFSFFVSCVYFFPLTAVNTEQLLSTREEGSKALESLLSAPNMWCVCVCLCVCFWILSELLGLWMQSCLKVSGSIPLMHNSFYPPRPVSWHWRHDIMKCCLNTASPSWKIMTSCQVRKLQTWKYRIQVYL